MGRGIQFPKHMHRDGDRFVCRIVVPEALRSIVGRRELTRTLGPDRVAAERLLPAVVAEFYAVIDRARAGAPSPVMTAPVVAPARHLSPAQMAKVHYADQIQFDEELRDELGARYAARGFVDEDYVARLRDVIAGSASDAEIQVAVGWIVEKFRARGSTAVVAATPEWRSLARALAMAEIESLARQAERDEGDWEAEPKAKILRPDPAPIVVPEPVGGFLKVPVDPVPLRKLFEDYVRELEAAGKGRSLKSRWGPSIERLIVLVGHTDAARLTRADLVRWKDNLVAEGIALKSVRDVHLAAIKAILRWGVDNARLDANPAEGVRVKVPTKRKTREQGFTDAEAKAILTTARDYQSSDHGDRHHNERPWMVATKRWVPWLCALTGARAGEMVQLRREDVRETDGIHYLRITPEAGTVKSGEYRDVPLHPQLIDLGFLDFVRGEPEGPLFYRRDTKRDLDFIRQQIVSVLGKWIRGLEIVGSEVSPNHGWRHRFKTVSREVGIDPRVVDAIQGHAGRTAGEDYGDVTIKARKAAIDMMPAFIL